MVGGPNDPKDPPPRPKMSVVKSIKESTTGDKILFVVAVLAIAFIVIVTR